jgi:hypothetical protein
MSNVNNKSNVSLYKKLKEDAAKHYFLCQADDVRDSDLIAYLKNTDSVTNTPLLIFDVHIGNSTNKQK